MTSVERAWKEIVNLGTLFLGNFGTWRDIYRNKEILGNLAILEGNLIGFPGKGTFFPTMQLKD